MSVNRVTISGNLTRDPELRATPGGTQVLSFGVAVNDRRKNQQTGQWEDQPNFIDCTLFGNRAEALSRILRKGMKVAVEGRLRQSRWQDRQTGQNRSKIEVIPDEVDLMQQAGGQQAPQYQQPAPQYAPQYAPQGYQQPAPQPAPQYQQQYQQRPQRAPQPPAQAAPQQVPQQAPQAAPQQAPQAAQAAPQALDLYDEDIPF